MSGQVKTEGARTWIEGVPVLRFRGGRDNQFIAAVAAVLEGIGSDITYSELMGLSASAFRVLFPVDGWSVDATDLLCHYPHARLLFNAIGYEFEKVDCTTVDPGTRQVICQNVRSLISQGMPVIVKNPEGHDRYGVIFGFGGAAGSFHCRTFDAPPGGFTLMQRWPSRFFFLVCPRTPFDRRQAIVRSLLSSLELAHTPVLLDESGASFACGFAAYDAWITRLADEEAIRNLSRIEAAADANGWFYLALADARAAAARYLEAVSTEFEPAPAGQLRAAAAVYHHIATVLVDAWPHVRWRAKLSTSRPWTPEMRRGQIDALTTARALEGKAVAAVEAALRVVPLG